MASTKWLLQKQLSGTVVMAHLGRQAKGEPCGLDDQAPAYFSSEQRATWKSLRDEFNALGILGRVNKPTLDVLAVAVTQLLEDTEDPQEPDVDLSQVFAGVLRSRADG